MKDPHAAQHNAAENDPFQSHHNKTDTHQQRYARHDPAFCFLCHPSACRKICQILFV